MLSSEELYGLGLSMCVSKMLEASGFEPDGDPARGGSRMRVLEDESIEVTVPVVDETSPTAVLVVTVDRESLRDAVEAVERVSGLS